MLKELKDLKLEIYPLTIDEEEQKQFEESGYLHLKNFFSAELIEEIQSIIWDRLPEDKSEPSTWKRSQQKVSVLENFCQTEREWQLFSHPKLIKIAQNLLKVDLDHLYWGKTGTLVINWPTNKDWTTLHLESSFEATDFKNGASLIYVLIYLTPKHEANAKTKLIPGSHKIVKSYLNETKKNLTIEDIEPFKLADPIEVVADIGDILLFDATLVHSGGGQMRPVPRLVLRTSFHNGLSSLKHIRTKVPQHLKKNMSQHEKHFFE